MNYLLAIDQGTSSTRVILYSELGEVVNCCQFPIEMDFPNPGWVEQDPEAIWQKTLEALQTVVKGIDVSKILTCGITNQRETVIAWDKKTGEVMSPAIVWQDRRTEGFCTSLSAYRERVEELTGLKLDPYFSATKMHWLLTNHSNLVELARNARLAISTVDSFLLWRLSKGKSYKTDVTNASRTLLFDIKQMQWSQELMDIFGIPRQILPEVQSCDSEFGFIAKEWLGREIPITGIAGDQQAALIGQNCLQHGMIKATFGTGAFLVMNTGDEIIASNQGLVSTVAYTIKNQTVYALEGSIYHAGTAVKWLRDQLQIIDKACDTEELADSLKSNDGVYFVSSFSGLGAPYWINTAGGIFSGITQATTRAHFARAVLEGVCYQARGVVEAMQKDSGLTLSSMRVDGGMAQNSWLLQFLANQCGVRVEKPKDIETTAKGAAILAALGIGLISELEQLDNYWHLDTCFLPKTEDKRTKDYQGWLRVVKGLNSRFE